MSVAAEFKVRDERIKAAMEQMKSEAPWSVQKFLSEVTDPTFDPLIQIIEQGMYYNFLKYLIKGLYLLLENVHSKNFSNSKILSFGYRNNLDLSKT